jgi:hypothetical protein
MMTAMAFADTLRVLNSMKAEGVIEEYAIAGAMALVFWTEPVPTWDLDVLVFLPAAAGPLVSLDGIHRWIVALYLQPEARTAKRRERAAMLLEWPGLDRDRLDAILKRHELSF